MNELQVAEEELTRILTEAAECARTDMRGVGILVSIGKWGGIYIHLGRVKRICLGFVAVTMFPVDGDWVTDLAHYMLDFLGAIAKVQKLKKELKSG